jgi:hypothetical protein
MPGYRLTAWLRPLLTLAAVAGVLSLAACGGGSGSPSSVSGGTAVPLAITPATGTAYSGNPFTFAITGGKQPYLILSSDQTVLPVVGTLNGNTLIVVPSSVGADTTVTLSVRDSAGQSTTATLTIKPQLLLPTSITVTGNTSCSAAGATLCSGQNGTASVLVTGPGGAPLTNRQVRFDVVQGTFAFVNPSGGPTVQTLTATTDQNGFAVVTLAVPASATTQIATIRATDVTSGNSISSNFTIVAFNNGTAVLSVAPTTASIPGLPASPPKCSFGVPVDYFVFGGTPPYTISASLPTFVIIQGSPVLTSGGFFTAITNGCVDPDTLIITDASGRFITTTFSSVPGPDSGSGGGTPTGDCSTFSPANPNCPTVTPSTLTLTACTGSGSQASSTISGGTAPYTAASGSPGVTALAPNTTLTVSRASGMVTSPVSVQVTDASGLFQTVTVNVSPLTCP